MQNENSTTLIKEHATCTAVWSSWKGRKCKHKQQQAFHAQTIMKKQQDEFLSEKITLNINTVNKTYIQQFFLIPPLQR
jgi:hypothetical protein